jgi:hypothetical protein
MVTVIRSSTVIVTLQAVVVPTAPAERPKVTWAKSPSSRMVKPSRPKFRPKPFHLPLSQPNRKLPKLLA